MLLQEFLDSFLKQLQRRNPGYERTKAVSSDGDITEIKPNLRQPKKPPIFIPATSAKFLFLCLEVIAFFPFDTIFSACPSSPLWSQPKCH